MLSYDEIIISNGIKIPFIPQIITPKIEKPMRNNRYEGGECKALRELLVSGDRVLEFGAGVGLLSSIAGQTDGIESVTAIEANPALKEVILETHKLNEIKNVDLRMGVVSSENSDDVNFYVRKDFWASSMEADSRPYTRVEKLPNLVISNLLEELSPTVIVCDIEGAELGLFDNADLSAVRCIILEFHPKIYGEDGAQSIISVLEGKGLQLVPAKKASTIHSFVRKPKSTVQNVTKTSSRSSSEHADSPEHPKVLVTTCMKDEGPFILEWVAWQKAVGVTDIVVFSNDCSDGTAEILDRLDELGEITHLPNPALASGSTLFQPQALAYTMLLSNYRNADYYISMDVDEFINVRLGDGHLTDLFKAAPDFDVLSMSEINHGSNMHEKFERGWVTEIFPNHQTENPGNKRARRGVKSIVRLGEKIENIRNHRPDMRSDKGPIAWLDGSGKPLESLMQDASKNGIDCRGTYDLVALNHFPLRSLDSYLVKMFRGDVVVKDKQVSQRYWRTRNKHEMRTILFQQAQIKAAKKYFENLLSDALLIELHEASCVAHGSRIEKLLEDPDFIVRKEWIFAEAWD